MKRYKPNDGIIKQDSNIFWIHKGTSPVKFKENKNENTEIDILCKRNKIELKESYL